MRYTIFRRLFPSLERRGGCAINKTLPFRNGADGVVAHEKRFAELTTPSAPLRWLRSIFLMAQPPLLSEEGNTLGQFIHTFVSACSRNSRLDFYETTNHRRQLEDVQNSP